MEAVWNTSIAATTDRYSVPSLSTKTMSTVVLAVHVLVIFRQILPCWFCWAMQVARQLSGGLVVVGILIWPPFVSSLFFVLGPGLVGSFTCTGKFPCTVDRMAFYVSSWEVVMPRGWWDWDSHQAESSLWEHEWVASLYLVSWFPWTLSLDLLYSPGNRWFVKCGLSVGKKIVLNFCTGHYWWNLG